MECLKLGLDNFLNRSIQTYVVNTHTVTQKPIAPADNPDQLEFNCQGHSDYYIDLNSVLQNLHIKLVKSDCLDKHRRLLYFMFIVSSNGKRDNLPLKAYLDKSLKYFSDASGTHLVSRFRHFDSPTRDGALEDILVYATRLNYLTNS